MMDGGKADTDTENNTNIDTEKDTDADRMFCPDCSRHQ